MTAAHLAALVGFIAVALIAARVIYLETSR